MSALSLGGGGIGRVYGHVEPEEALSTIRAAVEAGVDLLDLAPTYGPGETSAEAEVLVARAFEGRIPTQVRIASKVVIEDPCSRSRIRSSMRASLYGTLKRLRRDHLDVFILHSYIRPTGSPPLAGTVDVETVQEAVRPEFIELIREGLIGAWGLTGTAATDQVCRLLDDDPAPMVVQCVANAIDAVGNLWPSGLAGEPDNRRIRETARARGVSVMGIRALAAGALAGAFDRPLPPSDPAALDAVRAEQFRVVARDRGVSPAYLAYQYVLSLPDVATVVSGAKNREELKECLAAEATPALTKAELREIELAWTNPELARA